jgi:hypothetical protein
MPLMFSVLMLPQCGDRKVKGAMCGSNPDDVASKVQAVSQPPRGPKNFSLEIQK